MILTKTAQELKLIILLLFLNLSYPNFKEPTPGKESEQPGCDMCMQNFESGPEPGHLSVRRACVDRLWVPCCFLVDFFNLKCNEPINRHHDSSTVKSHFHFCTESLCNNIVFSSSKADSSWQMIALLIIFEIFGLF